MKNKYSALIAIVALLLASCTTPVETPKPVAVNLDSLRVEIQKMEDAYAAAEAAKDADAVAAYYSEDAISYGREEEPSSGRAAIRDRIAKRLTNDTTGTTNVYKVVDLFADGKIAVEIGSWSQVDTSGEEVGRGHYISYFELRDGKYICVRDMNVSSLPKSE